MMIPVRTLETSEGSRPESWIACSMAIWFHAAPSARKRMARRSITSAGWSVGAPCTWKRKPSSAYLSARVMPDFASKRLASTSWVLFPMDETIPIPVMTTRLMIVSPLSFLCCPPYSMPPSRLRLHGVLSEQADPEVLRAIDNLAVRGKPPIRDAENQPGTHYPLDVDVVDDLADARQHLAGKLQFAKAEGAAAALAAGPGQEEPHHLPQRIKAETAGHHRVALEMAAEEPEVGFDV